MNPDLFDAFAKIFATSQKDRPCDILGRFIKELSSTGCEASTWRLIQTLLQQSKENGTPLTQLARIKDWIAKTSVEEGDISEQEEYELEQQVDSIVAPFTKRQRLSYEVHLSEPTCRQQYLKIRTNDLRPMDSVSNEYSVMHYIVNEYINTNKAILGKLDDKPLLPSTELERKSWRECVCQIIKNERLGRYGKLLYYTLSGNTSEFLSECRTWEDVIWVYYNSQVEECITSSIDNIFIPDQIASLALTKETKNDATRFFHQIQTAILNNKITPMMDHLHYGLINRQEGGLYISNNPIEQQQRLRFIATLIIFGLNYLGWEETKSMLGLLSSFIELNSRDESFRPLVITIYCSLLSSKTSQVELYSSFLQRLENHVDLDEIKVVVKMAEKNQLDTNSMLKKIYESAYKNALTKCPDHIFKLDFITKANQNEEKLLNALKWLRIKPELGLNQSGNELIRYFLSMGRIAVVEQIIPLLDCPEENVYYKEVISHIELVNVLKKMEQWRRTMERKPVENDFSSNTSNIDLYIWKEEILELENTLSKNIKHILDGAWLNQDSVTTDKITNQKLRQLYVPDLIIDLHKVLYNHSSILPNDEASQLTSYITCERETLLKDIVLANRMDDVLDELRKSL